MIEIPIDGVKYEDKIFEKAGGSGITISDVG